MAASIYRFGIKTSPHYGRNLDYSPLLRLCILHVNRQLFLFYYYYFFILLLLVHVLHSGGGGRFITDIITWRLRGAWNGTLARKHEKMPSNGYFLFFSKRPKESLFVFGGVGVSIYLFADAFCALKIRIKKDTYNDTLPDNTE